MAKGNYKSRARGINDRDRRILTLMALDYSGPEIAREIGIAESTFIKVRTGIYKRLGAAACIGAVAIALAMKVIENPYKEDGKPKQSKPG